MCQYNNVNKLMLNTGQISKKIHVSITFQLVYQTNYLFVLSMYEWIVLKFTEE